MSGLAIVARALGAEVTGSDRAESVLLRAPARARHRARAGPRRRQPAAGRRGGGVHRDPGEQPGAGCGAGSGRATVLHRGELLGEVSRLKRSIAVSGTHGKTTTCAMIVHVLAAAGAIRPTWWGASCARLAPTPPGGTGEWIVVEADESDRSFLHLAREVAVITNVELDHHATYRSLGDLEAAFGEFAAPAEVRIAGRASSSTGRLSRTGSTRASCARTGLELLPLGSRFEVDGVAVRARRARPPQRAQRPRRPGGVPGGGGGAGEAAPALAGFAGAGTAFRGARSDHRRRAGVRRLRPPSDRGARHARGRPDTGRAARGGLLPAAPVLTHARARARLRPGAGLADLAVVVDVYPARERAEDFPGVSGLLVAQAAADAGHGRAGVVDPVDGEAARAAGRGARARATCCSPWARATWTGGGGPDRGSVVSEPAGVERDFSAGAAHHGPHGRARRLLRPPRQPASGWPSCWPGRMSRRSR